MQSDTIELSLADRAALLRAVLNHSPHLLHNGPANRPSRSPFRWSQMTRTPGPKSSRPNSARSCGVDVFPARPLESGFPLPSAAVTSVLHGQDAHFVSLLGPRGREGDREGLGIPAPTPANPHRL